MKVIGNLTITAKNAHEYAELESVGGWLYAHVPFNAPALTKVGGSLYVDATFTAPALTKVGGSLYVDATFTAPALTNIEDEAVSWYSYLLELRYTVLCTDNYVHIGCKRHTRDEWAAFTDLEINAMDTDALSFWREHKDSILNKNT